MSRRIYSTYLTAEEEDRVLEAARLNGTSVNFVVRTAIRRLLGMPAPRLELPAEDAGEVATSTD